MISHGEPVTWATCAHCFAYIPRDNIHAHLKWHELQENEKTLVDVHQENLIQRMHAAEKQIEAAVARLYFVERQPMGLPRTGDPQGHHHQAY